MHSALVAAADSDDDGEDAVSVVDEEYTTREIVGTKTRKQMERPKPKTDSHGGKGTARKHAICSCCC